MSTADFQERASSRRWQRDAADELVAGGGVTVAEFFDADRSRRLLWRDRPQAARLLQCLADPAREFDAVVVGEYERAFFGDQALTVLPLLDAAGVRLWLPEANGPVDLSQASHQVLMMLLGAQSKREVLRARFRALTAMRAQARDEGRFLGGRPLFGYRLVDAGPHPNPMHAKWGRRLQRYDPDPVTAPTVRWIFAQRLLGCSVSGIAAELNRSGVPCPSQADPGRNRSVRPRSAVGSTHRSRAASWRCASRRRGYRSECRFIGSLQRLTSPGVSRSRPARLPSAARAQPAVPRTVGRRTAGRAFPRAAPPSRSASWVIDGPSATAPAAALVVAAPTPDRGPRHRAPQFVRKRG
ncbi:hypothetical protein Dmats_32090 [Dactylosporangium matsuzakiense]|uniref:recombinase family protein n=1 Tax=Dactylosporangium matsuzakiense TaxID=53360 RepID=UPI0021C38707|nr:hypothetical protein Dmats_32090 [Dactylosporangium matsuzakiense]